MNETTSAIAATDADTDLTVDRLTVEIPTEIDAGERGPMTDQLCTCPPGCCGRR